MISRPTITTLVLAWTTTYLSTMSRTSAASVSFNDDKGYRPFPSVRITMVFMTLITALISNASINNIGFGITCMVNHTAAKPDDPFQQNESVDPVCRKRAEAADQGYDGDFTWSVRTQGYILSASAWGCLIVSPFVGWLPDKYGSKWTWAVGLSVSSIATMLCPLLSQWAPALIAARVVQGMGGGLLWPCLVRSVATWASLTEMGTMLGLASSGMYLGSMINVLISGIICDRIGWTWLFYVWGLAGLVWTAIWLVFYSDDVQRSVFRIARQETQFILKDKEVMRKPTNTVIPWKDLLKSPAVWAVVYCTFATQLYTFFIVDYMPTYLKDVLLQPSIHNGALCAIPYAMQLAGRNIAGQISDKITFFSPTVSVKFFNVFSLLLPGAFLVAVGFVDCVHVPLAVVLFCIGQFFQGFATSGFMKGMVLMAPSFSASIAVLGNIGGFGGGAIVPYVIPLLVGRAGDPYEWRHAFYFVAAVMWLGSFVYVLFGTGEPEPWGVGDDDDVPIVQDLGKPHGRRYHKTF